MFSCGILVSASGGGGALPELVLSYSYLRIPGGWGPVPNVLALFFDLILGVIHEWDVLRICGVERAVV